MLRVQVPWFLRDVAREVSEQDERNHAKTLAAAVQSMPRWCSPRGIHLFSVYLTFWHFFSVFEVSRPLNFFFLGSRGENFRRNWWSNPNIAEVLNHTHKCYLSRYVSGRFLCVVPPFWTLSPDIRTIDSHHTFRQSLKAHLFCKALSIPLA